MTLLQKAEDIGQELAARLARCRTAQGAETDLGARVFRGRRVVDEDLVPCCTVIEGSDEVTENQSRGTLLADITQQYVLLAYVQCDRQNPNDAAHAALRDLKKAVFTTDGKPDRTMSNQVRRVRYRGRDIAPHSDGAGYVCVALEVSVDYVEDLANP